jgi:Protein of unknown function (DUF1552)
MFITKMSLSRRTFLRGTGVSVALPFLEAMVPAFTATVKTAAQPTPRFGAIYIPHGAIMDQWTPATVGGGFEFKPILKALEPFKNRTIVVSNLARPGGESTNTHIATAAGWLSGAIAKPTEGADLYLGTTADQIVAKQIGQDTPFPSIELAVENFTGYIGACGTNYSCAYANTLAWSSPTTPLPTEINPRVAFERLFGRAGTREQRMARTREDRSILDAIRQDANELQRGLGKQDSTRLGDYLDNIREIERRIQRTEEKNSTQVTQLDAPLGIPESYADHVGLLFDIVAVAYQADLTRVFTLMMGREGSNRTYLDLDITEGHHQLSHHGGKPEQMAKHARLNGFHLQRAGSLAHLLRQRHEQWQRPLSRSASDGDHGWSGRQGSSPRPGRTEDDDRQPVDVGGAEVRLRDGKCRDQHRARRPLARFRVRCSVRVLSSLCLVLSPSAGPVVLRPLATGTTGPRTTNGPGTKNQEPGTGVLSRRVRRCGRSG